MEVALARFAEGPAPSAVARRWLLAVVYGIVSLYALFFVICARSVGPTDQDQFLVFHELQYWNAMLFGLAKQWAPVMCSGLSLSDEPQVPFMSLSMALGYLIGPFWGIKLAAIAYFVVGWTGAYLYAALWMRIPLQRALAAALFIGNGFFFCRLGVGHADFMPFLILPLILWMLHRACASREEAPDASGTLRFLLAVACMGAVLGMAIDGSPVAIIHLTFWIALYTIVLARTRRSIAPLLLFGGAVVVGSLLDAGYMWPMVRAQAEFPRLTADRFTHPLNLGWFALVPMRGSVMRANGWGHELSVFIGPVIAWAIWRHRRWLSAQIPAAMKAPLMVVSAISIVMGIGSLVHLGVPRWISPFDLLRPLPGFRSMGVTGRFWGFLALPLSLLGAGALWRFTAEARSHRRLALWMGALLLLQLGFQGETLFGQWFGTRTYHSVPWQGRFQHGVEGISYVLRGKDAPQGQSLSPTRAVVNCYDMDDFERPPVDPGAQLLRESTLVGASADFARWSQIQLHAGPRSGSTTPERAQWILNQAYHRSWRMPGCTTRRSPTGNLIADCPTDQLDNLPALTFYESLSELGARVSIAAWRLWAAALATCLVVLWMQRRTERTVDGLARLSHEAPLT